MLNTQFDVYLRSRKGVFDIQVTASRQGGIDDSPVSTSAMSMKWSSEADANIFPSWLKLSVLTGQSSLEGGTKRGVTG